MREEKDPRETKAYRIRHQVSDVYRALLDNDPSAREKALALSKTLESPEVENYLNGWGKLITETFNNELSKIMFGVFYEAMRNKDLSIHLLKFPLTFDMPSVKKRLENYLLCLINPLAIMAENEGEMETLLLSQS